MRPAPSIYLVIACTLDGRLKFNRYSQVVINERTIASDRKAEFQAFERIAPKPTHTIFVKRDSLNSFVGM
jgi:hypothetical protein